MDALIAVAAVAALVGLSFWAGLHYWGWFWLSMAVVLGIWELVSYLKTGKTMSQRFGDKIRTQPWIGWSLLAVYGVFFAGLLFHLAAMR